MCRHPEDAVSVVTLIPRLKSSYPDPNACGHVQKKKEKKKSID